MRGHRSRRDGCGRSSRVVALLVGLALLVAACGTPDVPSVEDEPPSDSAPSVDDDPTETERPTDPSEDDPTGDDAAEDDPAEPQPADVEDPEETAPDDQAQATEDEGLAAERDDLEARAYDPPAEEQPTADPDITNAEAVPDIEPFDEDEWDDDAPPPTVLDRARRWATQEAPEHFGGVWLDQDEGGVSVIGFTDDVESYAEELRTGLSGHLWVVRSDNSWEELEALNEEIGERESAEDWYDEDGDPRSGAIVMQGLRPSISRVTMMLLEPDEERLRQLTERYGAERICFTILGPDPEDGD